MEDELLFRRLKEIGASTLSDVKETYEARDRYNTFAGPEIKCMFPRLGITAGYAVTAQLDGSMQPPVNVSGGFAGGFVEMVRAAEAAPKPFVLVLQDIGLARQAVFGEMSGILFGKLGCAGLVCNSPIRDVAELERLAFPCFAAGASVSHGYNAFLRINVPVRVGGMEVRPLDIVHGDVDGVHAFSKDIAEKLLADAEEALKREADVAAFLRSGAFTPKGALERLGYDYEQVTKHGG